MIVGRGRLGQKLEHPFLSPLLMLFFFRDEEFMVIVIAATHLRQPDPIISSLAGRFFEKKGEQVDHGANLAFLSLL